MGIRGTRRGTPPPEPPKQKRGIDTESHRRLCEVAAKWLRRPGRIRPVSCPYVAVELVTAHEETPDVFGWCYWTTVLIEVKTTRSDFFADKKKPFRIITEQGIGSFRYYCCPEGLIKPEEVPEQWGLLYEKEGKIQVIVDADSQTKNASAEFGILASILRREGVKPQLFNYRKS